MLEVEKEKIVNLLENYYSELIEDLKHTKTFYLVELDKELLSICKKENILEPSIEIRLRYFEGTIRLITGDSQYISDLRGYWSNEELLTLESNLEDLAINLIKSCIENLYY